MIRQLSTWAVLGLTGGVLIAGCGESVTSTTTVSQAGSPAAAAADTTTAAAKGPAAVQGQTTAPGRTQAPVVATAGAKPTAGAWTGSQCNQAIIKWEKSHRGASPQDAQSYKQSLAERHGCFVAQPLPKPTSTSAYTSAQCNTAIIAWYRGHPGASSKDVQPYKRSLGQQHGCFVAKPLPTSGSPSHWTSLQCNQAIIAWYRSHRGASAREAQPYKQSLERLHGCYTSR